MNIFVLNQDPIKAADMQHNKHVVKMVLESTQMLCGAFDIESNPPYKRTHYNHPCSIWARTSKENYEWLLIHALALANEYTRRYNRIHASEKVIDWCWNNYEELIDFPKVGLTRHALAMPDEYKTTNTVDSYIKYYISEKLKNAKWTNRNKPMIFN